VLEATLYIGIIGIGLRFWAVGIVVALTAFFFFMQLKGLLFNRTVYGYFIVGMFFY
jgi:hypothetical protein